MRLDTVTLLAITVVKDKSSTAALAYAELLSFERDKNNTAY